LKANNCIESEPSYYSFHKNLEIEETFIEVMNAQNSKKANISNAEK